jgi:hypothetical protein
MSVSIKLPESTSKIIWRDTAMTSAIMSGSLTLL